MIDTDFVDVRAIRGAQTGQEHVLDLPGLKRQLDLVGRNVNKPGSPPISARIVRPDTHHQSTNATSTRRTWTGVDATDRILTASAGLGAAFL
jgi:hypothetical protein